MLDAWIWREGKAQTASICLDPILNVAGGGRSKKRWVVSTNLKSDKTLYSLFSYIFLLLSKNNIISNPFDKEEAIKLDKS